MSLLHFLHNRTRKLRKLLKAHFYGVSIQKQNKTKSKNDGHMGLHKNNVVAGFKRHWYATKLYKIYVMHLHYGLL